MKPLAEAQAKGFSRRNATRLARLQRRIDFLAQKISVDEEAGRPWESLREELRATQWALDSLLAHPEIAAV